MQLLAMVTMLIDHVGLVFFPDQVLWRLIGRVAFPLYAYALVQGWAYTSSKPRYLGRLAMIALVSQIPYQLALDPNGLNVVVTLLAGALVLLALEKTSSTVLSVLLVLGAAVVMDMFPFDYGAYGLFLILIFRYLPTAWLVAAHLLLNGVYFYLYSWELQVWSVIPTVMVAYGAGLWRKLEGKRVSPLVWRSFYPLHLAVLAVLQLWK